MDNTFLSKYYELLLNNKNFILIYFVLISILTAAMFSARNFNAPMMEIISFVFIVITGSFVILYSIKNKDSLHNVAFVVVLFFGILFVFLAPPFTLHDEATHFTRIESILRGVLLPIKTSSGFLVDQYYIHLAFYILDIYNNSHGGFSEVFLTNPHAFTPIYNYPTTGYYPISTSTPFYSYIFSVLGVFIAKSLNLGVIFAVWFSRIPNLIVYAFVLRFAIKKAPLYKMPLFVVGCSPLVLNLVPSCNYDSFICMCMFLAIAYFIYMFKNSVEIKDLLIFIICCFLIALIKPHYIIISLLLLFIPSSNFKFNNPKIKIIISLIFFFAITFLIYKGFNSMVPTTQSIVSNNPKVSISGQIDYLLADFNHILRVISFAVYYIPYRFIISTYYYQYNWGGKFKGIKLFNILYFISFVLFVVLYPLKIKLSKYKRIIMGIFLLICYVGLFFTLYVIWTPVGGTPVKGVQPRYFLPIIILLPLVFNNPFIKIKNIDRYVITLVVLFLAGLFMQTMTHFY